MARDEVYRKAKRNIDQARRLELKALDLSGGYYEKKLKLTELPESVGQLTHLADLTQAAQRVLADGHLAELVPGAPSALPHFWWPVSFGRFRWFSVYFGDFRPI